MQEHNRAMVLNHPENYDLGFAPLSYSIEPDTYVELLSSTDFMCRVLADSVRTDDGSFAGTYYEYLVYHYQYSAIRSLKRLIKGQTTPAPGTPIAPLDPFYLRGEAAQALVLAQKSVSAEVDKQTKLVTITVKAHDCLVAAMLARNVADELEKFASEYYLRKTRQIYEHLLIQIDHTYAEYQAALARGDQHQAAMLGDAYNSFSRQAIVLQAQMRDYLFFTPLQNASVPLEKTELPHMFLAICITLLSLIAAILFICRRELPLSALLVDP